MKSKIYYFRVLYTWDGGTAATVTSGPTFQRAYETFQRENPHLTVTSLENENGDTWEPARNPVKPSTS